MVWTPLHSKIHRTIRDRHLFDRNQRLLVGVSGGQDSLCLAKLLLDLQPKWGWEFGIIHCDHRWRADSAANAVHVANLAKNWATPFYLEIATQSLTSEAQARDWRYRAFSQIAQIHNYQYIVTGHTASDRAETLLYNLIRGAGADGLQALTWKRSLNPDLVLVRPMLEITRSQVGEFCQEFNLPIWEDVTNQNLVYARNRIRQELMPYLQENFNPRVEMNLAQTAELLQAEVAYLEQAAEKLREEVMEAGVGNHRNNWRFNRRILGQAPLALQRRVLRQILMQVMSEAPNFEHIQKLTGLISAPNRSQTDPFPGGKIALVDNEWIYLCESRL
jgi:tRNA(Ile)-lysidine synthase